MQLCNFLLRISPETAKWLGRSLDEKTMIECFSFKQHALRPCYLIAVKSFGQCQPESFNLPGQLGKPKKFTLVFMTRVSANITCISNFLDWSCSMTYLESNAYSVFLGKNKPNKHSDVYLIGSQEMLSNVGRGVKGAFTVGQNE